MTTPTRIYLVTNIAGAPERLVRATTQAAAIRHVVRTSYAANVAGQEALVDLVASGVKVEQAGQDDEQPPEGAPAEKAPAEVVPAAVWPFPTAA